MPIDDLDRANGHLFSAQSGGEQFLGPALGGVVFALSVSAPLLVDAFTFAASALLLSRITRRRETVLRPPRPFGAIRAGLTAFSEVPVLRVLLVLLAGVSFCQSMVLALLVIYATGTLHLSPAGSGLFIAAGSFGNVAGGFAVAPIRRRLGAATLMTVSVAAAAIAYLVLAATSSPRVAVGAFVVESFAVACGVVASMSLRQSAVRPELRGRIASIFRMAIPVVEPLRDDSLTCQETGAMPARSQQTVSWDSVVCVTPREELAGLLAKFMPEIVDLTEDALTRMRARLAGTIEMVYDNYNALVIGFSPTERPSDALFSIVVYPRHVNLCFLTGAALDDPDGILHGDGKVVRTVRLRSADIIDTPAVSELMDQAIRRGVQWNQTREPTLVIRSISDKRRPRRPGSQR